MKKKIFNHDYAIARLFPCKLGVKCFGFEKKEKSKNDDKNQETVQPTVAKSTLKFDDVALEWCENHTMEILQYLSDAEHEFTIDKAILLEDARSHDMICQKLVDLKLVKEAKICETGIYCVI